MKVIRKMKLILKKEKRKKYKNPKKLKLMKKMIKLTELEGQSKFGLMGHEKSRYAKTSKNIWIADLGRRCT